MVTKHNLACIWDTCSFGIDTLVSQSELNSQFWGSLRQISAEDKYIKFFQRTQESKSINL